MRKLASLIAASSMLFASTAAFADDASQAVLAPGKTAPVQEAQAMNTNIVMGVITIALIGGGLALVLTGNSKNSATTGTIPPGPPS